MSEIIILAAKPTVICRIGSDQGPPSMVGISRCSPDDKYDLTLGICIAVVKMKPSFSKREKEWALQVVKDNMAYAGMGFRLRLDTGYRLAVVFNRIIQYNRAVESALAPPKVQESDLSWQQVPWGITDPLNQKPRIQSSHVVRRLREYWIREKQPGDQGIRARLAEQFGKLLLRDLRAAT